MQEAKQLIYSPEEHIPIGEPVILPSGGHGIRFKWKRKTGDVTETVSLDKLHELVIQGKSGIGGQKTP